MTGEDDNATASNSATQASRPSIGHTSNEPRLSKGHVANMTLNHKLPRRERRISQREERNKRMSQRVYRQQGVVIPEVTVAQDIRPRTESRRTLDYKLRDAKVKNMQQVYQMRVSHQKTKSTTRSSPNAALGLPSSSGTEGGLTVGSSQKEGRMLLRRKMSIRTGKRVNNYRSLRHEDDNGNSDDVRPSEASSRFAKSGSIITEELSIRFSSLYFNMNGSKKESMNVQDLLAKLKTVQSVQKVTHARLLMACKLLCLLPHYKLDVEEFVVLMATCTTIPTESKNVETPGESDSKFSKELKKSMNIYNLLDNDSKGCLNYDDINLMVEAAKKNSDPKRAAEMSAFFDSVDLDENGAIDYMEFLAFRPQFMEIHEMMSASSL